MKYCVSRTDELIPLVNIVTEFEFDKLVAFEKVSVFDHKKNYETQSEKLQNITC
jgi:hypothetical protein